MGTTSADDEIENLHAQLRRAEAVKATYPDAYLGQLLDGRRVWMRRSAGDWCTHVMMITSSDPKDRAARIVPHTILCTDDGGAIHVFADDMNGGAIADYVLAKIRADSPEAYAALVQCAVSEAR
jgi:hypothetical protein